MHLIQEKNGHKLLINLKIQGLSIWLKIDINHLYQNINLKHNKNSMNNKLFINLFKIFTIK